MAKISIIIPSYNHTPFLVKRLESIYYQSYTDWEAIIIDDHSTDNSVAILEDFLKSHPDFKVKYFIKNKENSGSGYNSWKKGIELADTEYIWIAETDDFSDPHFLMEGISLLEKNNEVALFFSASNYIDEKDNFLYNTNNRLSFLNVPESESKKLGGDIFIEQMPFNPLITNGSSVIFRKPKLPIPEFIFSHKQSSDLFLWTFLCQNCSFIFLNKKLNYFRRHEFSTSNLLNQNKPESIYLEFALFLNYFKLTHKYLEFIQHYIKYYIWNHKMKFYKTNAINKIKISKKLKWIYYLELFKFTTRKIVK